MIQTPRLLLRAWAAEDAEAHNAMCRDPRVSAMLGSVPDPTDSAAVVQRQNALRAEHGYCFWALEHEGRFGGWCGLKPGKAPIEGELEIGWSLDPALWGNGLATEAARACLEFAWRETREPAVVAITAATNRASQAVMQRLGMKRRPNGDFDHSDLGADSPLLAHVTYDIRRPSHD